MLDAVVGPMIRSGHRMACRKPDLCNCRSRQGLRSGARHIWDYNGGIDADAVTAGDPAVVRGYAVAVAGYFYWLHEEPRATGPLAEALLARVDPDQGEQILGEVANAFFGDQAPIAERRAILETNGFDRVISPANVTLSCQRPIDGRPDCDRFNIYALPDCRRRDCRRPGLDLSRVSAGQNGWALPLQPAAGRRIAGTPDVTTLAGAAWDARTASS